jgi:hypothetical protein
MYTVFVYVNPGPTETVLGFPDIVTVISNVSVADALIISK